MSCYENCSVFARHLSTVADTVNDIAVTSALHKDTQHRKWDRADTQSMLHLLRSYIPSTHHHRPGGRGFQFTWRGQSVLPAELWTFCYLAMISLGLVVALILSICMHNRILSPNPMLHYSSNLILNIWLLFV